MLEDAFNRLSKSVRIYRYDRVLDEYGQVKDSEEEDLGEFNAIVDFGTVRQLQERGGSEFSGDALFYFMDSNFNPDLENYVYKLVLDDGDYVINSMRSKLPSHRQVVNTIIYECSKV